MMKFLPSYSTNLRLIISSVLLLGLLLLKEQAQAQTIISKKFTKNGVSTYKSKDGFSSLEVQHQGDIEVTDDDRGIKSISSGGFLKIKKTSFGNSRAIIVESRSNNQLKYEYYVGNREKPFEPDGKQWLADVLLEVVRKTGISAESRAKRIYAQKGASALLDEIGQINSSSGKRRYFTHLLDQDGLSERELAEAARKISSISSSSTKGTLLREYSKKFLAYESSSLAYFETVKRISSSSTKGSVLRHAIKSAKLDESQLVGLLEATNAISSSSEKGAVLRAAMESGIPNTSGVNEALYLAIDRISSTSEKATVLIKILETRNLSEGEMIKLLQSTRKISSSSVKGNILRRMLVKANPSVNVRDEFFLTVNTISSSSEKGSVLRKALDSRLMIDANVNEDFVRTVDKISSTSEKSSVLQKMLENDKVSKEISRSFFISVQKMASSSEKERVLKKAVGLINKDDNTRESFFSAVNTIASSSSKGNVLRQVIEQQLPNKEIALNVIYAATSLGATSEKTSVLLRTAEKIDFNDRDLKEAYVSCAKTISSSTDYRKVIDQVIE